jgi:Zn ribbon nucleic-acid-binding protein
MEMAQKKMKAGGEIQARCTKCKKTSAHTIVAMVDKEIVKVECLVCGSTHKYHPPEPEKAEPAKKVARKEPRKAVKAEPAQETKPAPEKKAKPAPAPKPPKKSEPKPPKLTDAEKKSALALTEWRNAVEGVDDDEFKPYLLKGIYQEDDYLQHAQFGKGRVTKIIGIGKMEVLFETGVRRLVYNRQTS